jgi:DNA-binding phage protein
MAAPCVDHEVATVDSLCRDPEFAAAYVRAVLEDGDSEEFATLLIRLAKLLRQYEP